MANYQNTSADVRKLSLQNKICKTVDLNAGLLFNYIDMFFINIKEGLKLIGILQRKYFVFFSILLAVIIIFAVSYVNREDQTKGSGWYSSGTYEVGKDIPAGEYYALSNPEIQGFFKINYVKSWQECEIKCWDNFYNSVYFTVEDGECLTVSYADFIKAEDAPETKKIDQKYTENSYKVGSDIPAGSYQLVPVENDADYVIEKNSLHSSGSVLDSDELTKKINIKVLDGQYLSFNNAVLVKKQ